MAIRKLIEEEPKEPINIEKERRRFIQSVGSLKDDTKPANTNKAKVLLRIKQDAIDKIDEIVANSLGISRHGWILQAIEEKLKKISET